MNPNSLSEIIDGLSPSRLSQTIGRLTADRGAAACDHIEVADVIKALLGDMALPDGAEGWHAQLALKRAIVQAAAMTDGLRYVEGDS